jgi:CysZ protein
MIASLFLSIGDLADRRILGVLVQSLLVTLLIFVVAGVGIGSLLDGSDPCSLVGADACELGASTSGLGAVALTLLAMWLLFPAIALGVIGAFVERISTVIEARHYPQAAARARSAGIAEGLLLGLRSAGRVLLYNLIALPLYILLLVTGVGTPIAFMIVNGIAFGADLGEMVASRHGDRAGRSTWMCGSRGGRMLIGTAVTALFLVPFVNLLAPVLGAAMMTHFYHRGRDAITAG